MAMPPARFERDEISTVRAGITPDRFTVVLTDGRLIQSTALTGAELKRVAARLGVTSQVTDDNAARLARIAAHVQATTGFVSLPSAPTTATATVDALPVGADETDDSETVDDNDNDDNDNDSETVDSDSDDNETETETETDDNDNDSDESDSDESDSDNENDTTTEPVIVTLDNGAPSSMLAGAVVAAGLAALDIDPNAATVDDEQVRVIAADVANEITTAALAGLDSTRPRVTLIVRDRPPVDLPETHHRMLPEVLAFMAAGVRHIWLTGPAGTGKSTIAEQAAAALALGEREHFYPMSVGPADMPSKLMGFVHPGTGIVQTAPPREAFIYGGCLLLDEIDNGSAGCTTAMNQLLANGVCSFPDAIWHKHADFRAFATGNTWGTGPDAAYVGRNQLDAATLNRFPVKLEVDYDPKLDDAVALRWVRSTDQVPMVRGWIKFCQAVRARVNEQRIQVIVSPRDVEAGAQLLTAGVDSGRVLEVGIFSGKSEDVRAKCDPGIANFLPNVSEVAR